MNTNHLTSFARRHIGIDATSEQEMLKVLGVNSLDQLIKETVQEDIRMQGDLDITKAMTESEYLDHLQGIADKNKLYKSYLGQGYYGTITPSVILRNVFQNPGWYTQYTPYQAEIAQGRLESLLNYQTMVCDLTGLPVANASLLDEGTAAAEAMAMLEAVRNKKRKKNPATKFFVDQSVFNQTVEVMLTRAEPIGIEIVRGSWSSFDFSDDFIGVLLQYPNADGTIEDYKAFATKCKDHEIKVCVAADILALALITPPGEWGADVAVGNTQRMGVPLGYGGPHAAYFATHEDYKRLLPGRIIGLSVDRNGQKALRMALQTREQHIRREKATSNICTAQALLANIAAMYAVYHGPEGIKDIALTIHKKTVALADALKRASYELKGEVFFDTIVVKTTKVQQDEIQHKALASEINLLYRDNGEVSISIDETTTTTDLSNVAKLFGANVTGTERANIPTGLQRTSAYLTHPTFSSYHTETKMMRYIKSLENKDLSLTHSMIALGSCTMKLNAATELIPVSWPKFANLHPFIPQDQAAGYYEIFEELSKDLAECTGFTACSLQPNSGAQGEYTGLMTIRAYHEDRGEAQRNVAIIPSSAHGTNPASAVMAGMKVVVVKCDNQGNIDVEHLKEKVEEYKEVLSSLMITYPSTHGVFEEAIIEICDLIHDNGGLVYMDGANMNAQVGLTSPGLIGADVCHLNLHKTFAIPHGGGGPGMGPICCNDKLAPYLPGHNFVKTGGDKAIKAVSAAPFGSASILLISYAYIKMLGAKGLKDATKYAILNANYMKTRLEKRYDVLYVGKNGRAAHEMILDLRPYKAAGVSAEDVAKRLIDYGFHAPTLSFPVAGTVMIEPTESESKDELDRFCDAMLAIREEIDEVARGDMDPTNSVLSNAPHTLAEVTADEWKYTYSRQKAAYPIDYLKGGAKFWATVNRVDQAHGDRNLICTCPPIEEYEV